MRICKETEKHMQKGEAFELESFRVSEHDLLLRELIASLMKQVSNLASPGAEYEFGLVMEDIDEVTSCRIFLN